jgi:hypothetical protein
VRAPARAGFFRGYTCNPRAAEYTNTQRMMTFPIASPRRSPDETGRRGFLSSKDSTLAEKPLPEGAMALRSRTNETAGKRPLISFRVFRIRGAASRLIGIVRAKNERDAIEQAVALYGIEPSERARLYARSDSRGVA